MDKILILDFGSQYTQLIARRIREMNVYCEIVPYNKVPALTDDIKGIILSGSPFSCTSPDALHVNLDELVGKRPLLGICYGAQYIAHKLGGKVSPSKTREYGKAHLIKLNLNHYLLDGVPQMSQVWMSHSDTVTALPEGFEVLAETQTIKVAAFRSKDGVYPHRVFGVQFHPEVMHSLDGAHILKNFVVGICHCKQDWTPEAFVESTIKDLRDKIGTDKVLLGLSGGVDSTVAAGLLHRAIGKNLVCIFVDNGLLRKDEFAQVMTSYEGMGLNVIGVDAKQRFWDALDGISEPEAKRKVIGGEFINVFDEEASKLTDIKYLAQGTIYPDVIESVSVHGPSATIKSHHNVGGLPERMNLKIVEPLRALFKDEVRRVGAAIDIPELILKRHPFPGPGLGIRILGAISPEKVAMLQEADAIYMNEMRKHGLYNEVWQAGAILLPVQSVGVMGDERTYEFTVALRAVTSTDGMTAEWSRLPYEFLAVVSNEIINNVRGINRVVYDISTKPPATIEWE